MTTSTVLRLCITAAAGWALTASLSGCTVVVQPPQEVPGDAAGSSTTSASPDRAPPSASPSSTPSRAPSPSDPRNGGCSFAMVDEGSTNIAMQALSRQLYDTLTCDGDIPVEEQLFAIAASDAFAEQASDVGATVDVEMGPGAVEGVQISGSVYLTDTSWSAMCSVMTTSNPVGKTMTCLDLGSGLVPPPSPDTSQSTDPTPAAPTEVPVRGPEV